mgnify:CR=1 FL=1
MTLLLTMFFFTEMSIAQTSNFTITLDVDQANAGAGSGGTGSGSGTATYDHNTKSLSVTGSFTGMTGNSSSCHVHQAATGANGGVVFGLTLSPSGSTAGNFSGNGTLSAAQETALLADGMYVNVHTSFVGSGELRGQIVFQNTLPVEMLYFNAAFINGINKLKWATGTELNNDYFEIQHSTNGIEFSTIDKVDGAGTTLNERTYEFAHKSPKSGLNYYRLRQVDFDGNYEFSNITEVKSELTRLSIYPNPVQEQLNIKNYTGTIRIFNAIGIQVKEIIINHQIEIDISAFSNGFYYLVEENGTTYKIIKN